MDAANPEPRTPDDPVARWVAEGLRDAEIAVRLGVSVGEARARRAGLTTAPIAPHTLALTPVGVPAPPRPSDAKHPGADRLRMAPLAAVLALALGAGAWWLLGAQRESPTTPATPVIGFASFSGPHVDELRQGPPIQFPADLSLVLKTGTNPDGSARALERLYRDAGGSLRREELLVAPDGVGIGAVVADTEGWTLVAAITGPGSTRFVRSEDGGVTWEELGALPGHHEPIGLWNGQAVAWQAEEGGLGRFTLVPSGEPFSPPYSDGGLPIALLSRGKLLWRAPGSGAIVESDLTPYLSPEIEQGSYHEWLAPQPTGAGTMIAWQGTNALGDPESYAGILNSGGELTQSWAGVPGSIAGRTDGATLIVSAPGDGGGWIAALVQLQADRWRPLAIGADVLSSPNEHFIASVRRGPFVRVDTRRECAPIYASADRSSDQIACPMNGVILRAPGEVRVHNDYTWQQVIAPTGRPGWVDIAHIR